jgi:signal transduction histidine kinase
MQDDPAMAEDIRRRFLAKMKSQADYLAAQVSDLLSLSRLEGPRGQLERAPLDLVALAREVAAVRVPVAETRGLSLALDLPAEVLEFNGDRRALEQALGNLLDNALQYTPAGGRVSLRLVPQEDRILCEVADTGIGIAQEHQERIFERFYRVDKARSREQGGTGLGLAIVKHVALAHGGGITLKSSPGRGSVFTLSLPRQA